MAASCASALPGEALLSCPRGEAALSSCAPLLRLLLSASANDPRRDAPAVGGRDDMGGKGSGGEPSFETTERNRLRGGCEGHVRVRVCACMRASAPWRRRVSAAARFVRTVQRCSARQGEKQQNNWWVVLCGRMSEGWMRSDASEAREER